MDLRNKIMSDAESDIDDFIGAARSTDTVPSSPDVQHELIRLKTRVGRSGLRYRCELEEAEPKIIERKEDMDLNAKPALVVGYVGNTKIES